MGYILVDIGGTKTRVSYTDDTTVFAEPIVLSTPDTPAAGLAALEDAVEQLGVSGSLQAAVIGIRGQLHEDKRLLQYLQPDDPLVQWLGYPIADTLEAAWKCPVRMENDTALAGLGETHFGAGKGFDLVVYHSVSTGVGGARIDHGDIDHASIGFEPGHQILDIDRTVLGDDIAPTLENLISGTAVAERMGVPAYEIPQTDVLWEQLAEYLGQGLRNTILYWSPEVIVLGGAMIVGDPRIDVEMVRRHTVTALDGITETPYITKAALGDHSGLYGAMAYAQRLGI